MTTILAENDDMILCRECLCCAGKCTCVGHKHAAKPFVGMGATVIVGSDRYPATVVAISDNEKSISIRRDNYKRTDNGGPYTESQSYEYMAPKPGTESVTTYTLRKNGRYVLKGDIMRGQPVSLGHREAYLDPSF